MAREANGTVTTGATPAVPRKRKNPQSCIHGRQKYACKVCGGGGVCVHGRRKHTCKPCGGHGICAHGRVKYHSASSAVMATASRTSTMNLIGRLQHQGDSYTRAIDIERERVLSLDKEIGEVRTEIMGLRQERKSFRVYNHVAGGIQAAQETNTNVAKEIKILEHRLNKALIRHSETINGNKKLQEEINYKRQKRLIFNEIYKKILSQLKEKQTSMEMVMKESNMANRQREGALKEEADLREIAAEEQEQFEIEYNELGHYIETQRRMKEHMKATGGKTAQPQQPETMQRGFLSVEQEDSMRAKLDDISGNMSNAAVDLEKHRRRRSSRTSRPSRSCRRRRGSRTSTSWSPPSSATRTRRSPCSATSSPSTRRWTRRRTRSSCSRRT